MRFGICTPVENFALVKAPGWEFVEEHVQRFLQAEKEDGEWEGVRRWEAAGRPAVPAANSLLPPELKVVGPDVDTELLKGYMNVVTRRAEVVGIKTLVFGSGGARMVPELFDRKKAWDQLLDFVLFAADYCGARGITLVAEHLNRGECNIVNTLDEAMELVLEANHPHFECLLDSWHLWLEKEPEEHIVKALPHLRHVHVADVVERRAPGQWVGAGGERQDYRGVFGVLKRGGYGGLISVEGVWVPGVGEGGEAGRVLEYVKGQWEGA